jgi:hypothetical protein
VTISQPARRGLALAAALAAIVLVLPLGAVGARGAAAAPVVKVTLNGSPYVEIPGTIVFSPKAARPGTVTFVVTNKDCCGPDNAHIFSINRRSTGYINPGQTATLKVTFKQPGVYIASCPDADNPSIAGNFKVG